MKTHSIGDRARLRAAGAYLLDGKQYLLVAAGDSFYAFTVNQAAR
ncbi:MAG TPA: hypothetical protein VNY05_04685 [Candidatus Acidoferrales bacterium]|nr:hypothetical protein [Candidatus Acidoferrales bacterium]